RVEAGVLGERAQALDLLRLAARVRRRQPEVRLDVPHALGALEALGEQVDERGVDVVDGPACLGQLGRNRLAHGLDPRSPTGRRCARRTADGAPPGISGKGRRRAVQARALSPLTL